MGMTYARGFVFGLGLGIFVGGMLVFGILASRGVFG